MYFEITDNIGEWVIGTEFCSGTHLASTEGFYESPELVASGTWGKYSPSWSASEDVDVFCQGRMDVYMISVTY